MDYLAHYRRPVIGSDVERLGLSDEPTRTQPLGILGFEFPKQLIVVESR